MSCFSAIKYRENDKVINFRAHHSTEEHKKSAQFIADETNKHFDGKTVVLTHHLPLSSCVSAEFVGSSLNPAFHANLDKLFENKIDYWFYGHTHTAQHQVVNGTVVQCNPRGYYGHESVAKTGFQVNLQINL
jgi:DNA repair exonuclease SbcCD nuclease subunit